MSANDANQNPAERPWRLPPGTPSLSEVHRSVPVPKELSFWRKMLAFSGPGYLVAVGYMDPGNWATSIAGGAQFGYMLLVIALLSNIMAIILQSLCARLAVGSGREVPRDERFEFIVSLIGRGETREMDESVRVVGIERENAQKCGSRFSRGMAREQGKVALRLGQHEPGLETVRVGSRDVAEDFDRVCAFALIVGIVSFQKLSRERGKAPAVTTRRGEEWDRVDPSSHRPAMGGRQSYVR